MFHGLAAQMNQILGVSSDKASVPLPYWNTICLEVFQKTTGEKAYPPVINFEFCLKHEILSGINLAWEEMKASLMKKVSLTFREYPDFVECPNEMADHFFGDDIDYQKGGHLLNCPGARAMIYLTLLDEIIPLILSSVNVLNSPTETSLSLLYRLLHRSSYILGNKHYEKLFLYMANILDHQRKNMASVHKGTIRNKGTPKRDIGVYARNFGNFLKYF